MSRISLAALALLALVSRAGAQSVTVPDKVQVDQPGLVVIRATSIDADADRWYSLGPGLQTFPADVVQPKLGVFLGFAMQPGVYKVGCVVAKTVNGKAVLSQPSIVVVTVGTPTPGPTPPGPTPPGPTPGPAPVPDAGMHVLIVYDKAKETTLPQGQQSILFSAAPRAYLSAKCATVAGKADWAIWPDGADASAYPSAPLKAMYARPRQSVPWLVISKDGRAGFEGALPPDVPSFMALVQKYGG